MKQDLQSNDTIPALYSFTAKCSKLINLVSSKKENTATPPRVPTPDLSLPHYNIPLAPKECVSCPDPCDDNDFEDYGENLEVDMECQMLGSVKDIGSQIFIATGVADWIKNIDEEALPTSILAAWNKSEGRFIPKPENSPPVSTKIPGVSKTAGSKKLLVYNTSMLPAMHAKNYQTTLLKFPSYTFATNVPSMSEPSSNHEIDAEDIFTSGRKIPYDVVIMLCSHKKRDKRCHIAAPILEAHLQHCLEDEGWEVDARGDDIEDLHADRTGTDINLSNPTKVAGIFKCSHVGGHKYAGNVILIFPNGSQVWYGRISPKHIPAVVKQTIINGKVIARFLRGGANIQSQSQLHSIH